jgi:hypothetical protein
MTKSKSSYIFIRLFSLKSWLVFSNIYFSDISTLHNKYFETFLFGKANKTPSINTHLRTRDRVAAESSQRVMFSH